LLWALELVLTEYVTDPTPGSDRARTKCIMQAVADCVALRGDVDVL
jgi:hypothetical protein